jgi:hypothetical protein
MRTFALCLALFLFLAGTLACSQEGDLQNPVRLSAGGNPIDVSREVGHSGPTALDFDKDGKIDLLVGTFSGTIHFFRNTGTNQEPAYEDKGLVEAGGKPIRVNNW